jgi:tetratricopeptide (TPR) repeat protein
VDVDERLRRLQAAVATDPGDADAHRALARALHDAKRSDEARTHFEQAAELDPGARSLLDLGLFYGSASRLGEAEAAYARLLEIAPEHPVGLHNLGNIATKRGDHEAAVTYYRRALAAKPDYLRAQYNLGDALRATGQYVEAFHSYEAVLEMNPGDAAELALFDDALYRMAALHLQMGAPAAAVPLLVELLSANPDHPSASYAYGQVLLQLGRTEEANQAFQNHLRVQASQEPTGPAASE